MSAEKNNKSQKVLVAPLDWGLGHATRCIPLIETLLQEGFEVWLAGSGPSGKLLATEFPNLPYQEIPAHRIQYSKTKQGFKWTMIGQLPKLLRQVQAERSWLENFLKHQPIDIILSDNRYGIHHPSTHNILITHQVGPRSGLSKGADRILARIHARLMKQFNACWVPDHAGHPNLSGLLGHPTHQPPIPIHYIGPLSRFKYNPAPVIEKKITIVLSGPEPQRTLLEEKCLRELSTWDGPVTLVRGLPYNASPIAAPTHWKVFDHLPTQPLQEEMEESERIIARCGYSTLMDLAALQKRAILIPTPGQPEQEYLADWIREQKLAHCIEQTHDLMEAMKQSDEDVRSFQGNSQATNTKSALQWIRSLRP